MSRLAAAGKGDQGDGSSPPVLAKRYGSAELDGQAERAIGRRQEREPRPVGCGQDGPRGATAAPRPGSTREERRASKRLVI